MASDFLRWLRFCLLSAILCRIYHTLLWYILIIYHTPSDYVGRLFPSFVSLLAFALLLVFVVAWSPSLVAWFFWVGQDVYKFRKCILFLLVVVWWLVGVCGWKVVSDGLFLGL